MVGPFPPSHRPHNFPTAVCVDTPHDFYVFGNFASAGDVQKPAIARCPGTDTHYAGAGIILVYRPPNKLGNQNIWMVMETVKYEIDAGNSTNKRIMDVPEIRIFGGKRLSHETDPKDTALRELCQEANGFRLDKERLRYAIQSLDDNGINTYTFVVWLSDAEYRMLEMVFKPLASMSSGDKGMMGVPLWHVLCNVRA